ncbi:hypothetical protein PG999_014769 [Apiospora kogelbergensis]|uniref:Uncharacterized protein n=1 Tax=Apiospora kogelbergensis TaxID=1337665 RepID=A0AAW0Q2E4_9PEZI
MTGEFPAARTSQYNPVAGEEQDKSSTLASVSTINVSHNAEQSQYAEEQRFGHPKSRAFSEKLGLIGLLTLILGSVAIHGAVAILVFIWNEASRARRYEVPSATWYSIVSAGWTIRVITICTAVIRAAVSFHTTLVTSMVASLMFEVTGTKTGYMPLVSILRAVSVAPTNLLWPSLSSFGPLSAVLVLSLFLAVATQLISTILLSDFENAGIASSKRSEIVTYGSNLNKDFAWNEQMVLLGTGPPAFWRFAEYTESVTQPNGTVDTGISYRAAVPFTNESSRVQLMNYSGPAQVWDTRVICTAPDLLNASYTPYPSTLSGYFQRNAASKSFEHLEFADPYNDSYKFICKNFYTYPSICLIRNTHTASDHSTFVILDFASDFNVNKNWTLITHLGAELKVMQKEKGYKPQPIPQPLPQDPYSWATISNSTGSRMASMTICVTHNGHQQSNVTMSGSPISSEPKIGFSGCDNPVNTSEVRHQFNAMEEYTPPGKRGVLNLSEFSPDRWVYHDSMFFDSGVDLVLTDSCRSGFKETSYIAAQAAYGAIFTDILNTTANPALALQTLLTMIRFMQYTAASPWSETLKGPASYVMAETVLIPARWNGLIAVISMVAIHMVIVVTITALFLLRTRVSKLGNVWQAVSQVVTQETLPVLSHADQMTDKEVCKELSSEFAFKQEGVVRYRKNGRVEFRPHYLSPPP